MPSTARFFPPRRSSQYPNRKTASLPLKLDNRVATHFEKHMRWFSSETHRWSTFDICRQVSGVFQKSSDKRDIQEVSDAVGVRDSAPAGPVVGRSHRRGGCGLTAGRWRKN